ncbi:PREDICTED: uncharacterized protein LOC105559541 isoform X1 [Vollenhovia emeryi]|uniref:uncharacterized protein LOC105559541 isoform X1 n=1 Tax=Vollenhovia emeryi TaxID=411798 RepID=UPI0005F5631C|nr:PREDICTED: uncharacterized protein LOC105559541 isoform X1 [Vollenhovia emeryi]
MARESNGSSRPSRCDRQPRKMGDDVDIYADLPGFSSEKNDQDCNCKEFKSELSSLASKLEDIQTTKATLERNLFSLLKTARAEIARKNKMIDDLRRRLDDVAFRRGSSRSETPGVSTRRLAYKHTAARKYENIPSTRSQKSKTETHQAEFHHDKYKSRKPQADVSRVPTLFVERLQKRVLEGEKEEKRQNASLKPGVEVQPEDVPEDDIAENDRENGSQFSVNNNGNESNIGRRSNSGSLERNAHRKILSKRTNEEDDTHRHKRLKIENEDKATTEETDYNYLMPYHLTDNPAACEIKDTVKFEDRPSAVHSFKKEEAVSYNERRATSEYRDTKQDQRYANGWRNAARDHDSLNARNELADNSRNSRTASTSNYVSEGFSSRYKRNGHRYSPPRRSYSKLLSIFIIYVYT